MTSADFAEACLAFGIRATPAMLARWDEAMIDAELLIRSHLAHWQTPGGAIRSATPRGRKVA